MGGDGKGTEQTDKAAAAGKSCLGGILVGAGGAAWVKMWTRRGECGAWVRGRDASPMMQLRQCC